MEVGATSASLDRDGANHRSQFGEYKYLVKKKRRDAIFANAGYPTPEAAMVGAFEWVEQFGGE